MRWPWASEWRAIEELDCYEAAQARSIVRRARGGLNGASLAVVLVTGLVLGWTFGLIVGGLLASVCVSIQSLLASVIGLIFLALGFSCGPLMALHLRDTWLRLRVRELMSGASCAACGYDLAGLPGGGGVGGVEGGVVCPECGLPHVPLATSTPIAPMAVAVCPECAYSLIGLGLSDDGVTCPECGATHSLESLHATAEDFRHDTTTE